jgi:hypothetical protein
MSFFDSIGDFASSIFGGGDSGGGLFDWLGKNPSIVGAGLLTTGSLLANTFASQATDDYNQQALDFEKQKWAQSLLEAQKDRDLKLALAGLAGGSAGSDRKERAFEAMMAALSQGQSTEQQALGNAISGSVKSLVR